MKICGNGFVSDWFQLVINIHDYMWNLRQTKHLVEDVDLCALGDFGFGHVLPSEKIQKGEIEVSKY